MKYYLLVDEDTHRDDCYEMFKELPRALTRAKELFKNAVSAYQSEADISDCDGSGGWYFCGGSDCGSFHISVRDIEVPL